MLCSVMMRAARQDLFEQGDVWARVAGYRKAPPGSDPGRARPARPRPPPHHRRCRVSDARRRTARPLRPVGIRLRDSRPGASQPHRGGLLHRGLRDVLAHHVIFAWNRLGLPYATQSVLAGTAKTAVFGPDPAKAEAG